MFFLILGILALPLLGILALAVSRPASSRLKSYAVISVLTSASVLVISCLLLKIVLNGPPLTFKIPLYGPFSPTFYVDILSALLVVLTALLWLAVSIYAPKYIVHESRITLFYFSTLATLFSVSGVFLSGDLFTMLLFFETITISSYFWVIHRWDKNAVKAGYFYLFFSIAGGLIISLGIVFMGAAVQTLPAIGRSVIPPDSAMFNRSIVLLIIGFGIKAGIAPLHLWLPRAHASAPTPGSALLSGILIKVGAYGVIRVLGFVGFCNGAGTIAGNLGTAISIMGGITMLVGVVAALLQSDAKRLLAYHSVSQMGYIILGLGIALYLGNQGGLALTGAIYHIINHALFKSALFLGMGILYLYTKKTDLYNLGSMIKRFPLLSAFMLLAALGIAGAPGLNGYISKTMIHHGLNIATEGSKIWPKVIEILFNVVGVGTAASFAKLYYLAFIKKASNAPEQVPSQIPSKKGSVLLYLPLGILLAAMLLIGLFPNLLLKIISSAAAALGARDASDLAAGFAFWNTRDIISIFVTLALGSLICWAGLKTGAFHRKAPAWLTIEGLAIFAYQGAGFAAGNVVSACRRIAELPVNLGKAVKAKLWSFFDALNGSKRFTIGKTTLIGISAAATLMVLALLVLTAGYAVANFKARLSQSFLTAFFGI
ncbi:MAG: complex I subunit 5 family protein [Oscillospiraceae bacterium]|nr:complex I subunit 5 family protein [Oscillospiraceae bacterium]